MITVLKQMPSLVELCAQLFSLHMSLLLNYKKDVRGWNQSVSHLSSSVNVLQQKELTLSLTLIYAFGCIALEVSKYFHR